MISEANRPKTWWSDDLYGAAGRMPVHSLEAFVSGGLLDAAVAALAEMCWQIALPADALSNASDSALPSDVSMIAVAARDVNLNVRLLHFVALGAQLDVETVPGVGWDCTLLEKAPVRLRHVLGAQWITQYLYDKEAYNTYNSDDEEIDVIEELKKVTRGGIISLVTHHATLSGMSSGQVASSRQHEMDWRRAATRVLHLRQQPGLWCCSHDSWANEDRAETSPGATAPSDDGRLRALCPTWPLVPQGQEFHPRNAAYFFQSPEGHNAATPVELDPPSPPGGYDVDPTSNLHIAQMEWSRQAQQAERERARERAEALRQRRA
jgi:hypothetical protein